MISARAEGLLERPTEIVRAQTDQLGKPGERYLLGKVLIDIGGDDALLPSRPQNGVGWGEAAPSISRASLSAVSRSELSSKNNRADKTVPAAPISPGVRILAGSK